MKYFYVNQIDEINKFTFMLFNRMCLRNLDTYKNRFLKF